MKNLICNLVLILLLISCHSNNNVPISAHNDTISSLHITYGFPSGYPPIFFQSRADYSPERFLDQSENNRLLFMECSDSALLNSARLCLQNTTAIYDTTCCLPYYNTDLVVLIKYLSGMTDTVALTWDITKPILINNDLFKNNSLSKIILDYLANNDSLVNDYIKDHYHKGEYKYCSKPIWKHNEGAFLPDYGCFEETKAQSIAIGLCNEDSCLIMKSIAEDAKCVNLDTLAKITTSCILFQQVDMLRLLINNGACIESSDWFNGGDSPLMIACRSPYYFECGRLLVESGANINVNRVGICSTPLHVCVMARNISMADYLLSHGANLHEENSNHQNAFDFAMSLGYYKMAYLFMKHGYFSKFFRDKKGKKISIMQYFKEKNLMLKEDIKYRYLIMQVVGSDSLSNHASEELRFMKQI